MKPIAFLFLLFLAGMIESCAWGPELDRERVEDIVIGETTRSQVLEWLGEPSRQTSIDDGHGETELVFIYFWHRSSQLTGTLASKMLTVRFNMEGIVVEKQYTASEY